MLDPFLEFIASNTLFTKEHKLLVAVSGGKDSTVLVDLLREAEFNFAIAHCNFQLRGVESEKDVQFVERLALNCNCTSHNTAFDTNKHAEEYGISTQMAARELRYGWFEDIMEEFNYDFLLTAHHLTDSLETALFNFTKGTGISGLRGIKPKSDRIRRPLLFSSRSDIDKYALDKEIEWREDESNTSLKYHRNKLRHEILPGLRDINPSLESTFINTSLKLRSLERLLDHSVNSFKADINSNDDAFTVSFKKIRDTETVVLDSFFKELGFTFSQVLDLQEGVSLKKTGNVLESDTHKINIDRTSVWVSLKKEEDTRSFPITKQDSLVEFPYGKLRINLTEDLTVSGHETSIKLAFENLVFPLELRKWQEGDYFQPLGMKGKKKLSDFMIDEKIPLNLKSSVWVLTSNSEVAWVVGRRIDDRFKITKNTSKALELILTND